MSQPAGYRAGYNDGPSPYKPLMFIGLAVLGVVVPWYFTSYEPVIEEVQQQWNLVLLLLPLLLLLALIVLASSASTNNILNSFMPAADPSSIHRVGGSPIGLGILLLLVLTMVWYHSDILKSWNPLVRY